MKRLLTIILSVFLLIALAIPTCGSIGLGTRAMGMGGAFTAVADDESAFYWNPAGITQVRIISLMVGAEALGEDFDFISDTISNISDKEQLDPRDFEPGYGLFDLGLIGGITTRFVGTNFYSEASGSVRAEKKSLSDFDIEVDLISFSYVTLTLAGNFGEKLSVGVNLKDVTAAYGEGVVNNSTDYTLYADGNGFAYDVGILYRLNEQVKFGFTARNFGDEIEVDGSRTYFDGQPQEHYLRLIQLPRDYAIGVSYRPFKNTLLAFDVQKSDARWFYPEQTRFRIGFEQTALWNFIALRFGAYTNKDEPLALTAGVGLKFGPLAIGVAAVREEIDGDKMDGAIVTAGFRF